MPMPIPMAMSMRMMMLGAAMSTTMASLRAAVRSSCRPAPAYQGETLVSYNLESEQAKLVRRGDFSLKNNPRVPKVA